MEVARIGAHKVEDIQGWFRRYEALLQKYDITASNLWNFDETGFMIGVLKTFRVVVSRARKRQDVRALGDVIIIIGIVFSIELTVSWLFRSLFPIRPIANEAEMLKRQMAIIEKQAKAEQRERRKVFMKEIAA
jgi:hypothetical protein